MFENITWNISLIISVLVIIALGYDKYKTGSRSQTREIIFDYETRQKQLKMEIEEWTKMFEKFKKDTQAIIDNYKTEITKLQTSNAEKEAHNKLLSDLLLDKNPDVIARLDENTEMMKEQTKIMNSNTEILEWIQRRNNRINDASIHGEWHPIMVPDSVPIDPRKRRK